MNDGYGYIKSRYNRARERDYCHPHLCVWPRSPHPYSALINYYYLYSLHAVVNMLMTIN